MPVRTDLLCGAPANGGPCTMKKGHYANFHRHRIYNEVTWTIRTSDGETLETGSARVPMNYAITRCFENHDNLVITLNRHQTGSDPGSGTDE